MSSLWRLPPLATILDPRSEDRARRMVIQDAANIPWDELGDRLSELPPRESVIQLADFRGMSGDEASHRASDFLDRGGRRFQWKAPDPAREFQVGRLWSPTPLLMAAAQLATGIRALDLGCGAGRDAVALASAGFEVVGVDILPEAVERMLKLRDRWRGRYWGDLTGVVGDWKRQKGQFDLVIAFSAYDPTLPETALRCLAPDGVLAIESFTVQDAESRGVPIRSHHVEPDRLPDRFPELMPIHAETYWHEGRHRTNFMGRRP